MADDAKKLTNILLIVKLIVDGLGLADEIKRIISRVEQGEDITMEEIAEARKAMDRARERWSKVDANKMMEEKEGD